MDAKAGEGRCPPVDTITDYCATVILRDKSDGRVQRTGHDGTGRKVTGGEERERAVKGTDVSECDQEEWTG